MRRSISAAEARVWGLLVRITQTTKQIGGTYPDENDGRSNSKQSIKLNQILVLFFVTAAIHVKLLDTLNSQLLVLESDFIGSGGEFIRIAVDVCGESSGEQDNLNITREHPVE
jgi:hypothetical protein